jgi:hypothetical protein
MWDAGTVVATSVQDARWHAGIMSVTAAILMVFPLLI